MEDQSLERTKHIATRLQEQQQAALTHEPLRLKATTPEDLKILSGLLQDALVFQTDFSYRAGGQTFTLLLNRFCWEDSPERLNHQKVYGRVQSCLHIAHVTQVETQNVDRTALTSKPHNLLSITPISLENSAEIILTFSGDTRLKLTLSSLSLFLDDWDDMTYTVLKPIHR